jgi:hypothetical protein
MATVTKTYYGSQGAPLRAVNMSDKLVITQPDSTGLEGYKTATINIQLAYDHIANRIKNTASGLVVVQSNSGLIGDGSASNPLRIDQDYFYKHWVANRYVNVSKVGDIREEQALYYTFKGGFTLSIDQATPVYLNGINGSIPAQTINLADYATNPANTIFYFYATLTNGLITLSIETTARPERVDVAFIAEIQVGATQITGISTHNVLRIDKYRFSHTPRGSSISVTDGNVADQVSLNWGGVVANTNTITFTSAGVGGMATTTISPVQRIYSAGWFGDVAEIFCPSINDDTETYIKFSTLGKVSAGSELPTHLVVSFENSTGETIFTADEYASDGSFKFIYENWHGETDFHVQMRNTTTPLRAKLIFW